MREDPIDVLRRHVPGIDELEDQRDEILVLDRCRIPLRISDERMALDLP